jgi:DNA recombination-mediator protein A
MTGRSNPSECGYQAPRPDDIQVMTVGELLAGKRLIIPSQQARLGYDSDGLGLRVWCAGDVSLVQKSAVSIVGTRNVSPHGAARARRLAKELCAPVQN